MYMCIICLIDEKQSLEFNISIDRKIGALVHGKYVVYSLNVRDKHYLRR